MALLPLLYCCITHLRFFHLVFPYKSPEIGNIGLFLKVSTNYEIEHMLFVIESIKYKFYKGLKRYLSIKKRLVMKKFVPILLLLVILIAGCKSQDKGTAITGLSELQIEACNSADAAGTCNTRLAEVGIVLKEDCCKELGKCC